MERSLLACSKAEPRFTKVNRTDWNSAAQSRLRSPSLGEIYWGQKSADAVRRLRDLPFQLVTSLLIHVAPLQQRQVHRPVGPLMGACAGYIKSTNKHKCLCVVSLVWNWSLFQWQRFHYPKNREKAKDRNDLPLLPVTIKAKESILVAQEWTIPLWTC